MTSLPYLISSDELHKEVTEQYPDPISSRTADDLPARSRGLLHNDIERCTGCGDCEKTCPNQCIRIATEPGSDVGKLWISTFDIDHSRCLFCGLCAEVCQPQSLTHTRKYEGAVYSLGDLIACFGKGTVTEGQRMRWEGMRKQRDSEEVWS